MGFRDKMRSAQEQAQQAAGGAGMGGMDMGAQAAYAQKAQKLAQAGVEAPGVIHSIRPTGQTDMGGGQTTEFDVSIRPADGGDPFQTTISQSMLPAQMEDLSEGKSITVKYDPDSPTTALIYGW
ncbi:MAG: hypothetical protein QOG86_363 [Thermoleophilaceae bacterium]|nr:hypothetical protein [Thermoleophilaceae bacterium]